MTIMERRTVLRGLSAAALAAGLPESIKRALAAPGSGTTGTIQDVQHIVVLMQENRSFDHYFGALRGVRGFGDPRAVKLSTGNSVFYQPNTTSSGSTKTGPSYYLPFPATSTLGIKFLVDLSHGWSDAHGAWNFGSNDRWIGNKGTSSLVYNRRADLPFHYALADAFTVCDAYHCSSMTPTDPNRYYMWTGWLGQNGTQPDTLTTANPGSTAGTFTLSGGNGPVPNGPVISNAESGYSWITYPERLQNAGISWKIYQDAAGPSLSSSNAWGWSTNHYIGNYGDTSILYFNTYRNATAGNPLYDLARTGTNVSGSATANPGTFSSVHGTLFDVLQADVTNNTLPQVSWIVAPEAYSEHGNWPSSYGAWYVANVLAALTSNPAVWSKTVLLYCFDENDGFFDHVVAPTPPATAGQGNSTVSTVNEIYPTKTGASSPSNVPYGLGARVPMIVISPWSKGGYVCSLTFDHTSIIRFIETRFGVYEPNISPWRRAVCGDLTACFDFTIANSTTTHLPGTAAYVPPTSDILTNKTYGSYTPAVPTTQVVPVQETGTRLARPLPYQLQADAAVGSSTVTITFANTGATTVTNPVAGFFHVRTTTAAPGTNSGSGAGPWGYTVEAGKTLSDTWTLTATGKPYDLAVHGHNGFYRHFTGSAAGGSAANLTVQCTYDTVGGGITVKVTNAGSATTTVTVLDNYSTTSMNQSVAPGSSYTTTWTLAASYSWYDFSITASGDASFLRRYAGHVETGANSVSDPKLSPGA